MTKDGAQFFFRKRYYPRTDLTYIQLLRRSDEEVLLDFELPFPFMILHPFEAKMLDLELATYAAGRMSIQDYPTH